MKFCALCNNLLRTNIQNEELTFKCVSCNKLYPADASDTLRYESSKNKNANIFDYQLRDAGRDPVNIKARIPCKKCKYPICKQVELSDDLKLFNICEKCGFKWLYE